jgi:bacillithiol biosynthesis cysteine-adding enzyme BshC
MYKTELVDFDKILKTSPLFVDYTRDFQAVKDLFYQDPRNLEEFFTLTEDPRLLYSKRHEVQQLLREYNERLGAPDQVLSNITRFRYDGTFCVMTGQQPGILGGPMYTLYKVITAIKLAKTLTEKSRSDFIPLFWNASEDHDLAEINRFYFLQNGSLVKEQLPLEPEGWPIADIYAGDALYDLVDQLEEVLPGTEHSAEVFELLRDCAGPSLSESFSRLMLRLFGKYGLVCAEPHDFRNLSIPILAQEITNHEKVLNAFRSATQNIVDKGYQPQIEEKEHLNLFYHYGGPRHRVFLEGNTVTVEGTDISMDVNDFASHLHRHPDRFSNGVVLRPLVQDYIFPSVAYICGPAEVAYFAQLKELYREFEIAMPILFPRVSATIVKEKIKRKLTWNELRLEDFYRDEFDPVKIFEERHAELASFFDEKEKGINDLLSHLGERVVDVDPSLESAYERALKGVAGNLEGLRTKTMNAILGKKNQGESEVTLLRNHLMPKQKPQERVLSWMAFLNLYGTGFIEKLMESVDIFSFSHHIIFPES